MSLPVRPIGPLIVSAVAPTTPAAKALPLPQRGSFDASPHTIAIAQVTQSLQGAGALGLPVPALLRRAGIPPALLSSPLSRVTQAQYAALIRVLRRTLRDELWGLCSRPLVPGSFAHACRLLIHCRTLGEALTEGFSFFRLLLHDFAPRLRDHQGIVTCSMISRRNRDARLAYAERLFCFFSYGLACWLVGRRIPLRELVYPLSEAAHDCGDARRMFEAPVRFAEGPVQLRFESRWMSLPVVQNPKSLEEFLRRTPRDLLVKYRDRGVRRRNSSSEMRRHMPGGGRRWRKWPRR